MRNKYDKPNATLEEAMKAGYKCTSPDSKPKHLSKLCADLGPNYHLASMNQIPGGPKDCVIHRVIGNGYDVEIFGPIPNSNQGRYHVALWGLYGWHNIEELSDVPFGSVGDRVEGLIQKWCPYID